MALQMKCTDCGAVLTDDGWTRCTGCGSGRIVFKVADADWQKLIRDLDNPPKANAKLKALMRSTPPWAQGQGAENACADRLAPAALLVLSRREFAT